MRLRCVMDTSLRTKIGRSLNVLGLRDVVRAIERALTFNGFCPANTHTPSAVERALSMAMDTGIATRGDYYEFGLYQGYTFYHAQKVVREAGNVSMRFIGLDSFEGLPQPQEAESTRAISPKASIVQRWSASRISSQSVVWTGAGRYWSLATLPTRLHQSSNRHISSVRLR
jgi:hypothetical protein